MCCETTTTDKIIVEDSEVEWRPPTPIKTLIGKVFFSCHRHERQDKYMRERDALSEKLRLDIHRHRLREARIEP